MSMELNPFITGLKLSVRVHLVAREFMFGHALEAAFIAQISLGVEFVTFTVAIVGTFRGLIEFFRNIEGRLVVFTSNISLIVGKMD